MLFLRQLTRCACVTPIFLQELHHAITINVTGTSIFCANTSPLVYIYFARSWMRPFRHVTFSWDAERFGSRFMRSSGRITIQDRGRSKPVYPEPPVSPNSSLESGSLTTTLRTTPPISCNASQVKVDDKESSSCRLAQDYCCHLLWHKRYCKDGPQKYGEGLR